MSKSAMIATLLTIVLLTLPPEAWSQTFICSSNPDYFSKRCTIHPNAITKVTNGVVEKGHLVGCQYKSWSCLKLDGKYQCKDNFGTAVVPFDFSMSDLKRFCNLLCTNPACTVDWQ